MDDYYTTIPFPFKEIKTPVFEIKNEWTLNELEGYIHSWSALQKFMSVNEYNPADKFIEQVNPYWNQRMKIVFPIHLRMGLIEK